MLDLEVEQSNIRQPPRHHRIRQIVRRLIQQPHKRLCVGLHSEEPSKQPKAKLLQRLQQSSTLQFHCVVLPFGSTPQSTLVYRRPCCPVVLFLLKYRSPSNCRACVNTEDDQSRRRFEVEGYQCRWGCEVLFQFIHCLLTFVGPEKHRRFAKQFHDRCRDYRESFDEDAVIHTKSDKCSAFPYRPRSRPIDDLLDLLPFRMSTLGVAYDSNDVDSRHPDRALKSRYRQPRPPNVAKDSSEDLRVFPDESSNPRQYLLIVVSRFWSSYPHIIEKGFCVCRYVSPQNFVDHSLKCCHRVGPTHGQAGHANKTKQSHECRKIP